MKQLFMFVLIILLAVFPSCKYFGGNQKARTLALLKAQQDSIRVADSLRTVQDHLLTLEKARQDSLQRINDELIMTQSRYNIIVGSFITPDYAKIMAEQFQKAGYASQVIHYEGTRFDLVSAESHGNFRKAILRLGQFKDTVQTDAWIYTRK